MSRSTGSRVALAIFVTLAGCASAPPEGAPSQVAHPDAANQFERMKTLVGTWRTTAGPSGAEEQFVYRLTGGGTALEETLFAGTPHEMVTLYHMDGPQLVLTHYCVMGNQPRMRAVPSREPGLVRFECVGVSNASHSDPHMHRGEVTFMGDDALHVEWAMLQDGELQEPVRIDLVRVN